MGTRSGTRLQQYRETCDPFHLGRTGLDQLGAWYCLLRGMAFPLLSGAVLLLRRRLYTEPGPWRICGMARPDDAASTIRNFTGFAHEASMAFQYTAVRTDGNGYVSAMVEPIRVDFDAEGARITPAMPNPPVGVYAEPIADGEFRVSWGYDSWGQGGWPNDFVVYEGAGEDSIDYETPLGTVDFAAGTEKYTYDTSESFGDGTDHAFAVRARNSTPVAEQNEWTTLVVTASATAPAAPALQLGAMRRLVSRRAGSE